MKKEFVILLGIFLLGALSVHCQEEEEDAGDEEEFPEDVDEQDHTGEGEVYEENDVIIMDTDNFDQIVAKHEILLVEFYAPWCGHCKRLMPEFERAAARLKENDPPVALGKVDATAESELGQRFDVSGYPTLKFFKGGKALDYEGPREEEGIVKYMQERAAPDWKPPPEAVIVLTRTNFSQVVEAEALILVEFYAPWCGHCKKLAPEYEKAAQELKKEKDPILLAKVDATEESELAKEYDVSGYPTFKMFRRGKAFEYKGGRDKWGIVNYMKQQKGPPSKELKNLKEVRSHMKSTDVTVVGFFKNSEETSFETYETAVNDLREDYELGHTFSKEARDNFKINAASLVVFNSEQYYTKHEPKYHVMEFKEDTDEGDVRDFIDAHRIPLVGQYSHSTKDKRYGGKRPLLLMFYTVDFSFDHRDATQMWRKKLADIAKDNKDMTFAIANEDDFNDLLKEFGLDDSSEEINIGIIGEDEKKYPMEVFDSFETEDVREFVKGFKDGKIKAKFKSQPIPKKSKGAVKVVVADNFEKVVYDKKKDVLIEFYAPWCGHCKSFEPKYKEMAKEFLKKEKNLVFAKMDATANDVPESYMVQGFPTLYFAPAKSDKTSPIKYEGDRSQDDVVKFLKEHATASFGKTKAKEEL